MCTCLVKVMEKIHKKIMLWMIRNSFSSVCVWWFQVFFITALSQYNLYYGIIVCFPFRPDYYDNFYYCHCSYSYIGCHCICQLPDVCYSWWVLASLKIIGRLHWINRQKLRNFILACQDEETGGFADRPGDMASCIIFF